MSATTMALAPFELQRATTLAEAAARLAAGARALGGGTDLLPNLRRGLERPAALVDLTRIAGLDAIADEAGTLVIGAALTLSRLAADARVAKHLPALVDAANAVAGPGHRSAATVGGNLCQDTRCVYYNQSEWWRASNGHCLKYQGDTCHVAPQGQRCHAAFCSDLAPVLIAARAQVEVVAPSGTRRLPLKDLYRDDGADHLTLAPGEFVARVIVPPLAGARSGYRKARVRGAMDFPLAGVAVVLRMQGGVLADLNVGLSGTNSFALELQNTESLIGKPVDDEVLARLSKLVQQQVSPMRSTVTASNYRRLVAATWAQRLVRELAAP